LAILSCPISQILELGDLDVVQLALRTAASKFAFDLRHTAGSARGSTISVRLGINALDLQYLCFYQTVLDLLSRIDPYANILGTRSFSGGLLEVRGHRPPMIRWNSYRYRIQTERFLVTHGNEVAGAQFGQERFPDACIGTLPVRYQSVLVLCALKRVPTGNGLPSDRHHAVGPTKPTCGIRGALKGVPIVWVRVCLGSVGQRVPAGRKLCSVRSNDIAWRIGRRHWATMPHGPSSRGEDVLDNPSDSRAAGRRLLLGFTP